MIRYHVRLGEKRTTLSISDLLSKLLALKLGLVPDSLETHGAVREWLQKCLDRAADPNRVRVSQWIQDEVILFVTDKELSEQYHRWLLEDLNPPTDSLEEA